MLRYLRILFIIAIAVTLLFLALANRGTVELHLLPPELAGMLGLGAGWSMPLFLVIFLAIALGVLIGFVWEWLREMRIRGSAKTAVRRINQLERELATLKEEQGGSAHRDEVLALLDGDARK